MNEEKTSSTFTCRKCGKVWMIVAIIFIVLFLGASTLAFLLSTQSNVESLQEVVMIDNVDEDKTAEVVAEVDILEGEGEYSNDEIGFSVAFNPLFRTSLDTEAPGFDSGESFKLTISSEATDSTLINNIFSLQATSADFGYGVQEGCCYFLPGSTFDMYRPEQEIETDLETKLDSPIWGLNLTQIDGKDAVEFYFRQRYVDTNLRKAVIVPLLDHPKYSNVFITSDTLIRLDNFGEDADAELAELMNVPLPLENDLQSQYHQILRTLQWSN